MKLKRSDRTQRALVALAAAVLVTLVGWGAWMAVAFVVGAVGWVLSSVGGFFQSTMNGMLSVRTIVFWVAVGSGALLAGLIGFDVSLDRFRGKARRSDPLSDNP